MTKNGSHLRQRKELGQVFLKEIWPCERLAQRLTDLGIINTIEIGPGGGILTQALLKAGLQVTAVEKDERFAERLEDVCRDVVRRPQQLTMIRQDILRLDLARWVATNQGGLGVCGNIPYNISSSVLQWVLPILPKLQGAVFMVQKEFADRVAASPGSKDYGSMSVFAQLRAQIAIEYQVGRELFSPVPRVDSAVFSLVSHANLYPETLLRQVEALTKTAFSQRRKKMRNSISKLIADRPGIDLGVDLDRRPESFSPGEYLELAQKLFNDDPVQ